MPSPSPIAVAIGDLHLSLLRPQCRADKDWLATQAGYLQQVTAYHLPVLCAGDVFDRWNPPPELIHFALRHLPDAMVSVPGQHDLPSHRMDQMHRSGYGVLSVAGKIRTLHQGQSLGIGSLRICGFGWEEKIRPAKSGTVSVALLHRYVWTGNYSYPGAPVSAHLRALGKGLRGYAAAISGDNHIPFQARLAGTHFFNCGTFIRRKLDEVPHVPRVGLLYADGRICPAPLDTSADRFAKLAVKETAQVDLSLFIRELEGLEDHQLDFREVVLRYLKRKDIAGETRELVLECLEEKLYDH